MKKFKITQMLINIKWFRKLFTCNGILPYNTAAKRINYSYTVQCGWNLRKCSTE